MCTGGKRTDTNLIGQIGVEGNTKDLEVKVEHGGLDHQHCDRRGVRHVWDVNRKAVLINNTGTVEKSGTTFGLKAMAEGADTNLIGKFGVDVLLPQILRAGG